MSTEIREGFRQGGEFLEQVVSVIRDDQWQSLGLGVWSVRELVGHSTRGWLTLETYIAAPAKQIDLPTPASYYGSIIPPASTRVDKEGFQAQIVQRARDPAKALGDDPVRSIQAMRARVQSLLDKTSDNAMLTVIGGKGIRLIDYLPSRVVELTIHALDIAEATRQDVKAPEAALRVTLHVLADVCVANGNGEMLAFVLTGRKNLPDGFSTVP